MALLAPPKPNTRHPQPTQQPKKPTQAKAYSSRSSFRSKPRPSASFTAFASISIVLGYALVPAAQRHPRLPAGRGAAALAGRPVTSTCARVRAGALRQSATPPTRDAQRGTQAGGRQPPLHSAHLLSRCSCWVTEVSTDHHESINFNCFIHFDFIRYLG